MFQPPLASLDNICMLIDGAAANVVAKPLGFKLTWGKPYRTVVGAFIYLAEIWEILGCRNVLVLLNVVKYLVNHKK